MWAMISVRPLISIIESPDVFRYIKQPARPLFITTNVQAAFYSEVKFQ
ncbi:hypothetical protein HMPREF0476_1577 [Kingella kingae ATCC 23330]|uniref:Uncharacterized protein n=1 Tax=Kingella kingae ATCC 23330 TaxID=887327 RepID=F5S8P4_KINKI|nr:hypothetical protein HMPREF0476_1577 [Kingella kingae ATCC 23330]